MTRFFVQNTEKLPSYWVIWEFLPRDFLPIKPLYLPGPLEASGYTLHPSISSPPEEFLQRFLFQDIQDGCVRPQHQRNAIALHRRYLELALFGLIIF